MIWDSNKVIIIIIIIIIIIKLIHSQREIEEVFDAEKLTFSISSEHKTT